MYDMTKVLSYDMIKFHLKGEKHSRPIKKSERSLLKHSLKFNSPSSIYMKRFSKLAEIELNSGNSHLYFTVIVTSMFSYHSTYNQCIVNRVILQCCTSIQ